MYSYPDNLTEKATLWLWQLKDLATLCTCGMISVLIAIKLGLLLPLALTAAYGVLTIRFESTSILDFLKYACAFFFSPRLYEWQETETETGRKSKQL